MALNSGFDRLQANSDTFSDWLNKTNEIVDLIRDDVLTANSSIANTTGDARLIGDFSANTLYTEVISGGDIAAVADLAIVSNTLFSNSSVDVENQLSVGANVAVDTNVLFVDTVNDRVGINKNNPVVALDVAGIASISANLSVNTDALFVSAGDKRVGVNKNNPAVTLDVAGITAISANLIVDTTALFVQAGATKRVGVNKVPTQGVLDADGDVYATSYYGNGETLDKVLKSNTDNTYTNGKLTVSTNTGVIFSSNSFLQMSDARLLNFGTANNVSMSGNTLGLFVTGSNVNIDSATFFIDTGNNRVGINKNNPAVALDVNGATAISSILTVSGNVAIDTNTLFVNTATLNKRVGVLKVPTQGALDVNGAIYANNLFISEDTNVGNITVTGVANIALLDVSGLQANGISLTGTAASVTTSSPTVIDSFPRSVTRGLKYIIQGNNSDASSAFTLEILCAHNNTTAFFTRFAELKNNFEAVLVPQINGANVDLVATCPSASVSNTHVLNIIKLGTGG
jgi:hypothetical protein